MLTAIVKVGAGEHECNRNPERYHTVVAVAFVVDLGLGPGIVLRCSRQIVSKFQVEK